MGRSESENAMSNVPPKSMRDLRPSERQFVDAMRRLGHGRFESVRIQRGELFREPPPTAVRSVKFGKPTPNRPQHPSNAFDLKQEVALDRTQPGADARSRSWWRAPVPAFSAEGKIGQ